MTLISNKQKEKVEEEIKKVEEENKRVEEENKKVEEDNKKVEIPAYVSKPNDYDPATNSYASANN